jgi:hypothetical protein
MTLKLDQAPASIFAKQKSDALLVRHSLCLWSNSVDIVNYAAALWVNEVNPAVSVVVSIAPY